jgi:hypothetical protein
MTSENQNETKDLVVFPSIFVISQQSIFCHMACHLDPESKIVKILF